MDKEKYILLKCPFCGSSAEVYKIGNRWFQVGCSNDKCFVRPFSPNNNLGVGDINIAIRNWNNRF